MQTIIRMQGDGRAIAHQLNNLFFTTFDHLAIRRDLARYVRVDEHQDEPNTRNAIISNLAQSAKNNNSYILFSTYIKNQYIAGEWGDTDILVAAAEFYLINVQIHQLSRNQPLITFRPKNPRDAVGTIKLTFNNNHFDSLIIQEIDSTQSPHLDLTSSSNTTTETIETVESKELSPEEQPDDTGYRLMGAQAYQKPKTLPNNIVIATWNVRGAATHQKKDKIDRILNKKTST